MRKLNKPREDSITIFELCNSKVRNVNLKNRLIECKTSIELAIKDYEVKAPNGLLHTITAQSLINGNVTSEEMKKVYTDRMVGKNSPARYIYNKWRSSSPNNICPLCAQRTVDTLDHHLAKTHYPIYSVAPINIFPACSACNKLKLDLKPNSPETELIHPYFDDLEDGLWLIAKVVESEPASIKFYTSKPCNWDNIKYQRVKNHFELFELEKLYASHSGQELSLINYRINKLFESEGEQSVKDFLNESWLSMRNENINSWQTATYKALSDSTWYQKGGFKKEI